MRGRRVDGRPPAVGPFPAAAVWAAILLLDLAMLVALLAALAWIGDRIEDRIWPGGEEWVEF